jgi:glycogen synthase
VFRLELDGVPVYLLHSQELFGGKYEDIYIDSERSGRGPLEDDPLRFAFFSSAVLEFIPEYPGLSGINALHCHDWHTGILLALLKCNPRYGRLSNALQTLFTIYNLDYQDTRPFEPTGEMYFIDGRSLEEGFRKPGSRLYGILNGLDYESNNPTTLTPPFDSAIPNWQRGRRQHKIDLLDGLAADLEKTAVKLGKRFKNSPAVLKKCQLFKWTSGVISRS